MGLWGIRVRSVVSEHLVAVVAAVIVLVIVGGWLTYTAHVAPGTVTEPEVQGTWEETAVYNHSATVTESNPVYPVGTTLEDRPRYYTAMTPRLEGSFQYGYAAPDGQMAVEVRSVLVVQAVPEGDDGKPLWQTEQRLDTGAATIAPGETVTVTFTVNVSDVLAEIEAIEDDIGASPGETQVFVRTFVETSGVVADGEVERVATYDLAITSSGDTYGVSGDGGTQEHSHVAPVTRELDPGPLRSVFGPLFVLLGLVGGFVIGYARENEWLEVAEEERVLAAFAERRAEFDDWISRGSIPESAMERPGVEVGSLEDLVDVAVDTNERVIEDLDSQRYVVLDEAYRYEYVPPTTVDLEELPETSGGWLPW